MRVCLFSCVMILSACGSESDGTEPAEPAATEPAAAPEPAAVEAPAEEPPPPQPEAMGAPRIGPMDLPTPEGTGPAREAKAAYRAMLTAYRDGDAEAYFDSYADTVRCYYGREDHPRSAIRHSRARVDALARNARIRSSHEGYPQRAHYLERGVVSATDEEVELVDSGWTGTGVYDPHVVFHRK